MKPVCFVVQGVYDSDPRVRRKAEALVAADYSVDVLALRPTDGKKTYSLAGVNVRTLSLGKKRGTLTRYVFEYVAFFVWAFFRLTVQMVSRQYAAIDVNTLPDFLVFASFFAKCMGAKVILDMHEITPEFYISKYGVPENSRLVRLLTYLERISFNFADRVITISDPVNTLLVDRGLSPGKSTVMMNAADESRFSANSAAVAVTLPANGKKFVMLYHGTLTRIYGLDIAIEAFAIAHNQMPGSELWILGSGTEKAYLAELIEQRRLASRVKLAGQVASGEVRAWLTHCDTGILPLRRDVFLDFAFPNKLSEFIIAEKPVIVSRLKTIRHYFPENALAYFEPNDPADLAAQMVRLYKNCPLRSELVARAKERYQPIRWDIMKERYLSLLDTVQGIEAAPGRGPGRLQANLKVR